MCTIGVNQSGKTDLDLFLLERLHALGLGAGFGSNLRVEANFPIDFIEDFETLKKTCMMLNPNPERHGIKRYFFFASEMGRWAAQDIPWKNTDLINELQTVRKYGLSLIGDGINRIDRRVFNPAHFHGYFEKQSKDHPERATYVDWTRRGKKTILRNIPRTSIKFNTFDPARFLMKPDIDNNEIHLTPQLEIIKKYLEFGSWKAANIHPQEGKRAVMWGMELLVNLYRAGKITITEEKSNSEMPYIG